MKGVVKDHSCFQISIDNTIQTAEVYNDEYDSFCQYNSNAACTFLLNSIDYNLRQPLCQLHQDADFFAILWLRFVRMVQPTSVNHFENIKHKLINLKPTSYPNQNIESLINDARNYVTILVSANQYAPTITVDLLPSIHNNYSQTGTFQHDLLTKLSQINKEVAKLLTFSHASSYKILQTKQLGSITVLEWLRSKYYTLHNSNQRNLDMMLQDLSRVSASISLTYDQRTAILNLLKILDKPSDQSSDKPSDKTSTTKKKPWRRIPPKNDEPQSRKHKETWFYWCKSCNLRSKTHGTFQHGNNKQKGHTAIQYALLIMMRFLFFLGFRCIGQRYEHEKWFYCFFSFDWHTLSWRIRYAGGCTFVDHAPNYMQLLCPKNNLNLIVVIMERWSINISLTTDQHSRVPLSLSTSTNFAKWFVIPVHRHIIIMATPKYTDYYVNLSRHDDPCRHLLARYGRYQRVGNGSVSFSLFMESYA